VDATEAVRTKLDIREFSTKAVPSKIKEAVLEAGRLTQSGTNSQHWRFILVQDPKSLKDMSDASSWGKWVVGANFAVIVCTDPTKSYHMIDAGREVQDMNSPPGTTASARGSSPASRPLSSGFASGSPTISTLPSL
jgi:nitroreductase